jgi:hypothetical protein
MAVKLVRFLAAVLVLLMVVGLAGAAWAGKPGGVPGAEMIVGPGGTATTPKSGNVKLWTGRNQAVVNGESKALDVDPMLYGGRTMVPLRFIAESLGADVQWDPAEQKITIAGGEPAAPAEKTQFDVILKIGRNQAFVNSEPKILDAPPMLYGGRTMVPLRFIAEALGADVQWDPAEQCVTITLRPMPLDASINLKSEPVPGAEVVVDYIPQTPAISTGGKGSDPAEKTQFDVILKSIKCKTNQKGEFSFTIPGEQFKKLPDEFSLRMTIIPPKGWTGISSSNEVTVKAEKSDGPKFEFVLLWQKEGDVKTNKGHFAVSSRAQT